MIAKDRVKPDIGANKPAEKWAQIDWSTTKKRVKTLRQRIYRATKQQKWNQVRSLMKLMLRSRANLLLSIRKITQENSGKSTPGLDGRTATTAKEREQLIKEMRAYTIWKIKPAKRIYIPKANGQQRPLGIICLTDRVAQAMIKNALEPSWEAKFESHSYGFRPGRSAHDALQHCWLCLKSNTSNQWVLDADIKGAFDNINQEYILKAIGDIPGKALIKRWLKVGYVDKGNWKQSDLGTQQGGVISPVLMNIALHGMQGLLEQFKRKKHYTSYSKSEAAYKRTITTSQYRLIRYADDFIVATITQEAAEAAKTILTEWLAKRGLQLHPDKTRIVNISEGFNFLGNTIKQYKGKCIVKPQKEKVHLFINKIRKWLKEHPAVTQETLIRTLNPIIRGWGEYYRTSCSKQIYEYADSKIRGAIWRWCLKRHHKKKKGMIAKKYFHQVRDVRGVFRARNTTRKQNKAQWVYLYKLTTIKIKRHIMVKDDSSPDDPEKRQYWQKRNTRTAKNKWAEKDKIQIVLNQQNGLCPLCKDWILNGEDIECHHKVPIKQNGEKEVDNLVWLHKICHKQIHSNKSC